MTTTGPWITPDWPAPANVRAYTTTRQGGYSRPPYESLNLSEYTGDDLTHVAANQERVASLLNLPSEVCWLKQVHGAEVVSLPLSPHSAGHLMVDGAYTDQVGIVCAVRSADCLPVLLCDRQGSEVAALHAGWRGLLAGVLTTGVNQMKKPRTDLQAWLGPALGPLAFEVGDEVRQAFVAKNSALMPTFTAKGTHKWLFNIYDAARIELTALGITAIYGGDFCTYTDSLRFFSYRREGESSGRMATLIWLEA